jgi:hypothetical protein
MLRSKVFAVNPWKPLLSSAAANLSGHLETAKPEREIQKKVGNPQEGALGRGV